MKKIINDRTILLLIALFIISGCSKNKGEGNVASLFISTASFNWTMINIDGDAHLIQIKDGKTILIDTGLAARAAGVLIPYIKASSIDKIDMVFLSHPHFDHYGGLIPLLSSNIIIGGVFFNMPSVDRCNSESWGCNPNDIATIQQMLEEKNIPLYKAEAGMNFDLGNESSLEILYAFNLSNSPVSNIGINDESLIMLLQHKNYRFLYTGDIGPKIGTYLAERGQDLQALVLKLPHHGTADIAPNSFFDSVNPQYALVPSPQELWCSDRSSQARNWITEKDIPVYVNGFQGHVHVGVVNDELIFLTEYDYPNSNLCN